MDDALFTAGAPPENVLIFDGQKRRRLERAVRVVQSLRAAGYTVYAFVGQNAEPYRQELSSYFVRAHIPIDAADAREVIEAKKTHGKVAVVLHGLIAPGGKPMNRLLADEEIVVVSVSCVPAVRGDHRYSRVWTSGGPGWRARSEPKGFAEPAVAADGADQTWFQWLGVSS